MLLLRKVTPSKWRSEGASVNAVPADAITADMRTTQNALSFWRASDPDDLSEAELTLLTTLDRLETIRYVVVAESEFGDLKLAETENDTAYTSRRNTHRDAASLCHAKLIRVALVLASKIYSEGEDGMVTVQRSAAIKALREAVKDGRVSVEKLKESVRDVVTEA